MMKNSHFSKDAAVAASQSKKERDYWLNKLSGNPAKTSFSDAYKTSETLDINKRTISTGTFGFSSEMSAQLLKLSNQSDHRLHIIMVTGVMLLLYKYTGSKDIIVGAPVYKQEICPFQKTIFPCSIRAFCWRIFMIKTTWNISNWI